MKNLYLGFLTLSLTVFMLQKGHSQWVGQGAWMIGGDVSFSSYKVEDADESVTSFVFSPTVGYFVIDDLAVGLGIDYRSRTFDGDTDSQTTLSPAVRY